MFKISIIICCALCLSSISNNAIGQNCGTISSWSYAVAPNGSNIDYTITFDALSGSGGNKGVTNIVVACNGTTINTNSNCYVTAPSGSAPNNYNYTFTAAACGTPYNVTLTYDGRTNSACGGSLCLSGASGGAPASAPVNWLETSGVCNDGLLTLNWSTAMEENNLGFIITKFNGSSFDSIGWVDGNGNSESVVNYSFAVPLGIDDGVFRLSQVDFDHKQDFSEFIKVQCTKRLSYFWPNPATSAITFNHEVSNVTVKTMQGKTVQSFSETLNRLDVSELESGIYFVNWEFENRLYTKKLVVQP